ncbi:MAG: FAD-dependent oxidoreductase [Ruminococcus callidus]|nr:FAD-dependent oxidoreductase [Ruminococcus callidus]
MYDIIIIGSGPAGLTAAIYANRARLQAVVLEKDYLGSGQIAVSEQVDNYPGLPGIDGYTLGEKFREHAEQMGAVLENAEVSRIEKDGKTFTVFCKDGKTLQSRSILCAVGTSYRRLDVKGSTLPGVSYCATCDGAFYKGKTVAVVGGGDTALGDALYLSHIAEKVYLIHRRDTFRANQSLQEAVKRTANIELVLQAVPIAVLGEERVTGLEILQNGKPSTLQVNGVFVAIGSIPNTSFLQGLCELDASGYLIAGETGVTTTPGIFAAGDVRTTPLRQVVTAVADGANCVQSIEQYLMETSG